MIHLSDDHQRKIFPAFIIKLIRSSFSFVFRLSFHASSSCILNSYLKISQIARCFPFHKRTDNRLNYNPLQHKRMQGEEFASMSSTKILIFIEIPAQRRGIIKNPAGHHM